LNVLRSLEQNRAKFAYDLIKRVVDLREQSNLNRLNGLLRIIFKDIELTNEEFEILRTDREGKKIIFDTNFQKSFESKLSSYITKAPTMILVNGLGNTMAFYISKIGTTPHDLLKGIQTFREKVKSGESVDKIKKSIMDKLKPDKLAYLTIYTAINDWLKEMKIMDCEDVIEWFKRESTSSLDILHATKEVLELLKWMKRFGDAMLEEGE